MPGYRPPRTDPLEIALPCHTSGGAVHADDDMGSLYTDRTGALPETQTRGSSSDAEHLSLRLVQSIPRFARDGKVRFLLAEPRDPGTDSLAGLKFDPKSSGGLGRMPSRSSTRLAPVASPRSRLARPT